MPRAERAKHTKPGLARDIDAPGLDALERLLGGPATAATNAQTGVPKRAAAGMYRAFVVHMTAADHDRAVEALGKLAKERPDLGEAGCLLQLLEFAADGR